MKLTIKKRSKVRSTAKISVRSRAEQSLAYSKKAISHLAQTLSKNFAISKRHNCVVFNTGDLQIKCHAPKEGNPNVSYEFYGTDPDDCFGFDYTEAQAIALLAAFELGRFWEAKIYRKHWLKIAAKAKVRVPKQEPIKPGRSVIKGEAGHFPAHPVITLGPKFISLKSVNPSIKPIA